MPTHPRLSALLRNLNPGLPRRYLLLVAGLVWTFAGGLLFGRGSAWLLPSQDHLLLRYGIALSCGLAFFAFLFTGISRKHVDRILGLEDERPRLFSFFDRKSYIMMASMIGGGILLRASGLIPPPILYTFYVAMGTPLLLSALRFYLTFASSGKIDARPADI